MASDFAGEISIGESYLELVGVIEASSGDAEIGTSLAGATLGCDVEDSDRGIEESRVVAGKDIGEDPVVSSLADSLWGVLDALFLASMTDVSFAPGVGHTTLIDGKSSVLGAGDLRKEGENLALAVELHPVGVPASLLFVVSELPIHVESPGVKLSLS